MKTILPLLITFFLYSSTTVATPCAPQLSLFDIYTGDDIRDLSSPSDTIFLQSIGRSVVIRARFCNPGVTAVQFRVNRFIRFTDLSPPFTLRIPLRILLFKIGRFSLWGSTFVRLEAFGFNPADGQHNALESVNIFLRLPKARPISTQSVVPVPTATSSASMSAIPSMSASPSMSGTPSPSPSTSPTQSPSATPSTSPSTTPTVSPSPSQASVSVSLISQSSSTFNPPGPLIFAVDGSDISQSPGNINLAVNSSALMSADIDFNSTFITADVLLPPGPSNITIEVITGAGATQTSSVIWIGLESLTVNIIDSEGNLVSDRTTVTAVLADDLGVSETIETTSGTVVFDNIPERTILLEAVTASNVVGATAAIGSQGVVSISIFEFSTPSTIDNNNFTQGLAGWNIPNPIAVELVTHEENVGPNSTDPGSSGAPLSPTPDPGTIRQTLVDMDLKLATMEEGPQMVTRTFRPSFGTTGVEVRYRFITSEIPGGFFGSEFNDFFSVVIRSRIAGAVVSETASMNGLGLAAFDFETGSTAWRTATLPLDGDLDDIEVMITVANVGDGAFGSCVIVDFVEELDCNLGEELEALFAIGPIDAIRAKMSAVEAENAAESSGLSGPRNGPQDAFRHCLWNCLMTQDIGADQARSIGDRHEACGNGPFNEQVMDLNNNAVGRSLGVPGADCEAACMGGIFDGSLQLSP